MKAQKRQLTTRQHARPLTAKMLQANLRHDKMQAMSRNMAILEILLLACLLLLHTGVVFLVFDLLAFALTAYIRATT